MKKVLCFGDSNVYGFIPESKRRYDEESRWTGILRRLSAEAFEVVEEGCNNRTAFQDNPWGKNVTGYKVLPELLKEHYDIVILALGLNDIQKIYNTELNDIEKGITNLVKLVEEYSSDSRIILAAPAVMSRAVLTNDFFSKLFDESSVEKSLHYPEIYKKVAEANGCIFVDWNEIVEVSPIDGLHLSKESHLKIARKFYEIIKPFLDAK